MGGRGSEVARQAADLVLADDELGTVVSAVEEGRRVYGNIRRFLLHALAGGTAEILVMLLGPLVGLALPLLPAQILWINLITRGLPGVALGGEPVEPGVMRRPPRPPAESVVGGGLWQRVPRVGAVIAALTLGVAVWGHASGRPWQSMAFFTMSVARVMMPNWPSPARTESNSSGLSRGEQVTILPAPVTTSSSHTLSVCMPYLCVVPPTPPIARVPPTERSRKFARTGGTSWSGRVAARTERQVAPAPTVTGGQTG